MKENFNTFKLSSPDNTLRNEFEILVSIDTVSHAFFKGPQNLFHPTTLGIALVEAYDAMGLELSKPFLRAKQEAELCDISNG